MIVIDKDENGNLVRYHMLESETEKQMYRIASEVCERKLQSIGIDTTKPNDMQQDFNYLRQRRSNDVDTLRLIKKTIIGYIVPGIIFLCILGAMAWLQAHQK